MGILEFWRIHKASLSFPIVDQVARWLLVIAISSGETERLLVSARRTRGSHCVVAVFELAKAELPLLAAYTLTREWKRQGRLPVPRGQCDAPMPLVLSPIS